MFRYDLDTFDTQLTDLTGNSIENERVFDHRPAGAYSTANQKHYYGGKTDSMSSMLSAMKVVYQAPPDKVLGIHGITSADGRYICNMIRDKIDPTEPALEYPYSYFPPLFEGKPLTQIIRVEVATGKMDVIHEDRRFMTHVNLSPTLPDILTFCHEGPWHLVEQRIWGLNINTGESWEIRPQDDGEFAIGHEYWFADGEHIGYHGRPRDGQGEHVFGYHTLPMNEIRIRPIDPNSEDEIDRAAQWMRATLIEVEGEETGITLYSLDWLRQRVRWHLDPACSLAAVLLAEETDGSIVGHSIVFGTGRTERRTFKNHTSGPCVFVNLPMFA